MKCPYCEHEDSRVIDSRSIDNRKRRRRECLCCRRRFTTYEIVEVPTQIVQKRDGSLQPFDRNKLLAGIFHAIKKRPVTIAQVDAIADAVEDRYTNAWINQLTSDQIGAIVLEKLKKIDDIAYIRFASVYQNFEDAASFLAVVSDLE